MSIASVMPSNHLILCHPLLLPPSIFPSIRVFSNESVIHIKIERIGVSTSASVLPMNIQDWFPLALTGLMSLQSKGLWRVFSSTTVGKHNMDGGSWYFGLRTIYHYRNANESCNDTTSPSLGWLLLGKKNKINVGDDVEKLKPLCMIGRSRKMVKLLWKVVWWFLKKNEIGLSFDSAYKRTDPKLQYFVHLMQRAASLEKILLWCWERLKAGEDRGNRGCDCWMASLIQWTWVWANSRR